MDDVSKHLLYDVLVLFPAPSAADLKAKKCFKQATCRGYYKWHAARFFILSITTATAATASPPPPSRIDGGGPRPTSQVASAHRELKQTTLNKPSCLCLLSAWHMKDMRLCDAWRPYQAHATQKNDLARTLQLRGWKQSHPSGRQMARADMCSVIERFFKINSSLDPVLCKDSKV